MRKRNLTLAFESATKPHARRAALKVLARELGSEAEACLTRALRDPYPWSREVGYQGLARIARFGNEDTKLRIFAAAADFYDAEKSYNPKKESIKFFSLVDADVATLFPRTLAVEAAATRARRNTLVQEYLTRLREADGAPHRYMAHDKLDQWLREELSLPASFAFTRKELASSSAKSAQERFQRIRPGEVALDDDSRRSLLYFVEEYRDFLQFRGLGRLA